MDTLAPIERPIQVYDEKGSFEKTVKVRYSGDKLILSFGWPCEYYADSLFKSFPFKKDLCIDVGGKNHRGSSVYIRAEDLNSLLIEVSSQNLKNRKSKVI